MAEIEWNNFLTVMILIIAILIIFLIITQVLKLPEPPEVLSPIL